MPYKRGRKGKQSGPGRTTPIPAPASPSTPAVASTTAAPDAEVTLDPTSDATTTAAGGTPTLAPLKSSSPKESVSDLILTSEKRRGVYECDYCHADISQVPRIRCAVCPDFDLCLECFTTTDHAAASARLRAALATQQALQDEGTVVTQTTTATAAALHHDHTHGYRVCDSTRYPLFATARHVSTTRDKTTTAATTASSTTQSVATSMSDYGGGSEPRGEESATSDMDVDETTSTNNTTSATTTTTAQLALEDLATAVVMDDPRTVWTAEEDLRLLEGISSHGLGNWAEIAEVVSGQGSVGKTARRCMERYMDDFLGKHGHILPPYTLVMEDLDSALAAPATPSSGISGTKAEGDDCNTPTTTAFTSEISEEKQPEVDGTPRASKRRAVLLRSPGVANATAAGWTQRKRFKCVPTETLPGYEKVWPTPYLPPGVTAGTEVGRDVASKAEQTFVRLTTAAGSAQEAQKIHQEWQQNRLLQPGGPTVLPPRLDDICSMQGSELIGFMPRRGDFDIEWENDAEQAVADMEFLPGEPLEDKKLKLQVLAIYNSKLDEREKRKNFIITRQLWDYKKAYSLEAKLPSDERDLVLRMRLLERFHTPTEHKKFLSEILKAKRLRKEIAKLQMYRRMGIRTLAEAERYELDKQRRLIHRQAAQHKDGEDKKEDGTSGTGTATESDRPAGLTEETTSTSLWKQYRTGERRNRKSINRGASDTTGAPEKSEEGDESSKTREEEKRSVEEEPVPSTGEVETTNSGVVSTLSSTEQELCEKLELTENQYKEIKKALICQSLTQGLLDKESIGSQKRSLVKLDAERRKDVIEFILRAGWISANKAGTLRQQSSNIVK